MKEVTTIGLDLAKNVFQVHGVDASGEVVMRRQLRRRQMIPLFRDAAALFDRRGSLPDLP